jgi:hypothetical protein
MFVAISLLILSLYDVTFFHSYPLMIVSLALGVLARGPASITATESHQNRHFNA